ncbi:MAG: helix-turn-helix transcriptional regulator, partial [Gemmatimonadetes bacterium]|nr:helix-turn-helix transcriptional regulator [Gemmatimonadota bacterium]
GLHGETGDLGGTARALEALGGLAIDHGRLAHAARLFGAAEALRIGSGATRTPAELPIYQLDADRLRAEMPADELEEAWAQGTSIGPEEAVALAVRGRGTRDRPARGWASLSPAERQVVELAVEGLTNPEIGEKLFISSRTVQGHLARTYRKLGISSRRQLRDLRR